MAWNRNLDSGYIAWSRCVAVLDFDLLASKDLVLDKLKKILLCVIDDGIGRWLAHSYTNAGGLETRRHFVLSSV